MTTGIGMNRDRNLLPYGKAPVKTPVWQQFRLTPHCFLLMLGLP